MDIDGDGIPDVIGEDLNEDGSLEVIEVNDFGPDSSGADEIIIGLDDEGPQQFEVDLDGDGFTDALAADTNGDGLLDSFEIDTDGDGIVDSYADDLDGDGLIDDAGLLDEGGDFIDDGTFDI
jgi:hypothetical protein